MLMCRLRQPCRTLRRAVHAARRLTVCGACVQLRNVAGFDKQRLEVKYDTFHKKTAITEELVLNKYFKVKAAADSKTVRAPCLPRHSRLHRTTKMCTEVHVTAALT